MLLLVRRYLDVPCPLAAGALCATLATVIAVAATIAVALLLAVRPLVSPTLYHLLQAAILLFVANGWFVALMQTRRAREQSRLYSTLEVSARYLGAGLSLAMVLVLGTGPVGLLWGETLGLATVLSAAAVGVVAYGGLGVACAFSW